MRWGRGGLSDCSTSQKKRRFFSEKRIMNVCHQHVLLETVLTGVIDLPLELLHAELRFTSLLFGCRA